jgi:hypothetical protein
MMRQPIREDIEAGRAPTPTLRSYAPPVSRRIGYTLGDILASVGVDPRAGQRFGSKIGEIASFLGVDAPGEIMDARRDYANAEGFGGKAAAMAAAQLAMLGALPVGKPAKGGKLAMDEASRMARAKALGFNTSRTLYHGTNQPLTQFDKARGGMATGPNAGATRALFFTDNPIEAGQYAENAGGRVVAGVADFERQSAKLQADVARLERQAQRTGDWEPYEKAMAQWEDLEIAATREESFIGTNIIPAHLRLNNPKTVDFQSTSGLASNQNIDDIVEEAQRLGHDGIILKNIFDAPQGGIVSNHYAVFDPKNIRSRFAAFDPAKRNSSNLLAGTLAGGLGYGMMAQQEPRR